MDTLVSIVVPIYNTKEYLYKCVDSIIKQTYQNIELILVDDGSWDGSALLCDELAETDERIIVIHRDNGGLVMARKTGLRRAKGKYILNVDSDDWIEMDMVEQLLKAAEENDSDIVTSGYYEETLEYAIEKKDTLPEGNYNTEEEKFYLYQHMIRNGIQRGVNVAIWCKLVRSDIMREIYLEMSDEIRVGEDAAFIYSCLAVADKITILHNTYYHYMVREGTMSRSKNRNYFKEMNEVILFIEKNFKKNKYKELLKEQLDYHTVVLCLLGIEKFFGLEKGFVIPRYWFPQRELPMGSKIIIYGAGAVGRSYYKKIKMEKLYEVVCWMDKKYLYYQKQGIAVFAPEKVAEKKYDYILLALQDVELAKKVKSDLKEKYHIEDKKILWYEPIDLIAECMEEYDF
ncbi:MAG: glycosyltransferase family 2 protein [Ruminococcus flavefaciens]|nr:glycosyltransferase family 2 protein [Roseburia sp.]MCM1231449.1 glycosyltransferase family 2 protein [Ruminococcus flavefaciens]